MPIFISPALFNLLSKDPLKLNMDSMDLNMPPQRPLLMHLIFGHKIFALGYLISLTKIMETNALTIFSALYFFFQPPPHFTLFLLFF